MTTPCVALVQFLLLGKTISGLTIAALAGVCIGVGLTNSNAAGTTKFGASLAVASFIITAFYQVGIFTLFSLSLMGLEMLGLLALEMLLPYTTSEFHVLIQGRFGLARNLRISMFQVHSYY